MKDKPSRPRERPYQAISVLKLLARVAPPGQRWKTMERILRANGYIKEEVWRQSEKQP